MIDNFIDGFLSFVDNVKSIFEEVGNFFLLHPTVMYITLFLWGVGAVRRASSTEKNSFAQCAPKVNVGAGSGSKRYCPCSRDN